MYNDEKNNNNLDEKSNEFDDSNRVNTITEEDKSFYSNVDNYNSNIIVNPGLNKESKNHIKVILLIIIVPIFFFFVFFLAFFLARNLNLFENYKTQVEYTYNSKTKSNISVLEKEIENALEKNNLTSDELIGKYNELEAYYDEVETYARIEYANTCYYVENANSRRYQKYRNILDDMDEWFSAIKSDIYYSGYSQDFFKDYTDYEIDLAVNHPDTKESIAKEDEANEVATKFSELDDPSLKEGYEYLANYVKLNNEFAKLKGYDNYLEYAYYEEYNRDYTYNDTLAYASYVNDYILGNNGAFYYMTSGRSTGSTGFGFYTPSPFVIGVNYLNYSEWDQYTTAYANYMGGDYLANYTNFTTNGYLVETDEDYYEGGYSTYLTAYDKPLMYLGGDDYQNVFTYIHEFGHCNAFYSMKNNPVSLDLCETQSQGNEMMFLAYLKESNAFEYDFKYLRNYQEQSMLESLITSSVVNTFEVSLYTSSEELTADSVESLLYRTYEYRYKNSPFSYESMMNYAQVVMISSPGYYISYSTSAVAAFELLAEAFTDYSSAMASYNYLANYANYTTFRDTIINSGLSDPLSEETFKKVFETNLLVF